MLKENVLDCSWEQFEELIKRAIGSDFIWKIRPRDTEANRQAVVESIERMLGSTMVIFRTRGICSSSQRRQNQLPRKAGHRKEKADPLC